jgi:hypothetical protein
VAFLASEYVEDRGKLFGKQQEAPVGRQLFIPQSMDEAARGQAGGGDAAGDPEVVHFRKEAADLAPAGSFAGFTGFADQDDKEVQTVTRGFHHTVRGRPYEVAEGGEKLQENGGRIGFGVRRDGADDRAGDTVERCRAKARPTGIPLWGRRWRRWIGLLNCRRELLLCRLVG